MNGRNFIAKIVKDIETKFGCICYACEDGNSSHVKQWWSISLSDYGIYTSEEFGNYIRQIRQEHSDIPIVFNYCNPLEKNLAKLAERDNLILSL